MPENVGLLFRLCLACLLFGLIPGLSMSIPQIKVLVQEDGLYRVTGKQISELRPEISEFGVSDKKYGTNLITDVFAACGTEMDVPEFGPVSSRGFGELSVVETKREGLPAGSGKWCLRLVSDKGKGQVRYNTETPLRGNTSYVISFLIYTIRPESGFTVSVMGPGTIDATNEKYAFHDEMFFSDGMLWTRILARIDVPEGGAGDYALKIANWEWDGTKARTWYIDELTLREITHVREGRKAVMSRPFGISFIELTDVMGGRINVYHRGRTVPIDLVNMGKEGKLNPGTEVRFYGEMARMENGDRDYYSNYNAYFLDFNGKDPPHRFEVQEDLSEMKEIARPHPESHIRTRHIEEDQLLRYKDHYAGRSTDRTFWKQFSYPGKDFHVEFDAIGDYLPDSSEPTFARIKLWGGSLLENVRPDHSWEVVLNGFGLDTVQWDGKYPLFFDAPIPGGVLKSNRENRLEFRHEVSDQLVPDVILLDWIELEYPARLQPDNDYLELNIGPSDGMVRVVTEAGFSRGDTRIYDIDNGVRVENSAERGWFSGKLEADFVIDACGESRRIVVAGSEGCLKPDRLMLRGSNPLENIVGIPEYLVITHVKFMEAVRPLIDLRRSQGLEVMLVDVEDIYDRYNAGIMSPFAIQSFIHELKEKSNDGRRLRYVFLVGGATYDYREVTPDSNNYVPTIHSNAVGHLPEYAPLLSVDDFYIYVHPEYEMDEARSIGYQAETRYTISIGRLPSTNIESVEAYVDKVIEYEQAQPMENHKARALVIAAHGYHLEAERFSEHRAMEGFTKHMVLAKDDVNGADIQGKVISSINKGCDVLFFAGHGSWGIWKTGEASRAIDQTDVLTCRQVEQLENRGRYPIIFATTCFSAIFDNPIGYSYDKRHNPTGSGIGVYFVESPGKGGIACVAHVGKADTVVPTLLAQRMMMEMNLNGALRLGDAFIAAKNHMPARFLEDVYGMALIGDPGLYTAHRFGLTPRADPSRRDAEISAKRSVSISRSN